jgi:hypothetical protein
VGDASTQPCGNCVHLVDVHRVQISGDASEQVHVGFRDRLAEDRHTGLIWTYQVHSMIVAAHRLTPRL